MAVTAGSSGHRGAQDMSGKTFPFTLAEMTAPRFGLIALQSDETIEADMRRLLPTEAAFLVSRVPSDTEVTSATLAALEAHLTAAAALFPTGFQFDAVGYGCTSGTAEIGADQVAANITSTTQATCVTEPLSGLIAACMHLGVRRLAVLSPYVAEVSSKLQNAVGAAGIATPVFGSFNVSTEATVVRIDRPSIEAAAVSLMDGSDVDALFISCTNLRTLDVIAPLEQRLGTPVLTSNQVLAWHMMRSAGVSPPEGAPGLLFKT